MSLDTSVSQWYVAALTAAEAKEMLQYVPGCLAYGSLKSFALLPETAKQVLRDNYQRLLNQTNGGV